MSIIIYNIFPIVLTGSLFREKLPVEILFLYKEMVFMRKVLNTREIRHFYGYYRCISKIYELLNRMSRVLKTKRIPGSETRDYFS